MKEVKKEKETRNYGEDRVKVIHIRVSNDEYDRLTKICTNKKITLSKLLRNLIKFYIFKDK